MKVSVKIEGLNEIRKRLRSLPDELQQRELMSAVAEGAKVVRDEARALAPVLAVPTRYRKPGVLRRNIRATRGVRRGSEASAFVSVRKLSAKAVSAFKKSTGRHSSQNPDDPFYWKVLEFSTGPERRPFLRRAFENAKRAAAEAIKKALRAGVDSAAKRLGGR